MKTRFLIYYVAIVTLLSNCGNSKEPESKQQNTNKIPEKAEVSKVEDNKKIPVGTYSFGETTEKASGVILFYPTSDSSVIFNLELNKGAPSYNMGSLTDKLVFRNNEATYFYSDTADMMNCKIYFKMDSDKIILTSDESYNDCGFGGGVYANGEFKLIDSSIPQYYENGEGEKVYFKDEKFD